MTEDRRRKRGLIRPFLSTCMMHALCYSTGASGFVAPTVPSSSIRNSQQWQQQQQQQRQQSNLQNKQREQQRNHARPRTCTWLAMAEGENKASSMSTALCIVPPEEAWDTIQRARYVAKDTTYRRWPPAIRLFHPFFPRHELDDAALDLATWIDKQKIRPFKLTFNDFAVIPHLEAMEVDLEATRSLPAQQQPDKSDSRTDFEKSIDRLIQDEEKIGAKRLERRKRKGRYAEDSTNPYTDSDRTKVSPRQRLEQQRQMYEEFNGPCLVVLEPDRKSRQIIETLREKLRKALYDDYDKFSPSSSISITGSLPQQIEKGDSTFRPIIPLGGFASVSSAVSFAKKLKGLWKPLSFTVTDLQFISEYKDDTKELRGGSSRDDLLTKVSVKDSTSEETFEISDQFGCDAAVMFIGEEIEQDEEINEIMVDFLMREGVPGAGDTSTASVPEEQARLETEAVAKQVNINPDDVEELLEWLDEEDDDMDEGTVVVIGRTHFFTGETRSYDGMPAASIVDGKDRVLGSGVDAISRRRAGQKGSWDDGDFGSR